MNPHPAITVVMTGFLEKAPSEKGGIMYKLILIVLFAPILSFAESYTQEVQAPAQINKELEYLLSFVGPNRANPGEIKPELFAAVLQFVRSPKDKATLYYPDAPDGISSAYFETELSRSLAQILRLAENPQVPAVFTAPSTVRLSRWKRIDTPDRQRPKLWESLAELRTPVFFSGVEHLVNTPDQTTGAYYEYDLDRTLILTKVDGQNLFISLSRQVGVSEAGKKGLIIGGDDQWDYLYTTQYGLNRFGLGWVDSFMYNSYSVAFYLEDGSGKPAVKFGVFKWLRAGWSDINLVKRSHIYEGLRRFSGVFKELVENRRLADSTAWMDSLLDIQRLKSELLRQIVQDSLAAFQRQVEADASSTAADARDLLKDGAYLKTLGLEEMRSVLVLEYLKQLLGKETRVNLRQRLAQSQ